MNKAVCIQNAGVSKDLGSAVCRKTVFQCSENILCDLADQGILPVLKDGDLILGFITGI